MMEQSKIIHMASILRDDKGDIVYAHARQIEVIVSIMAELTRIYKESHNNNYYNYKEKTGDKRDKSLAKVSSYIIQDISSEGEIEMRTQW